MKAGPRGIKNPVSIYHTGFPDARWNVKKSFVVGDRVITRWTGHGTNAGSLQGQPPPGKKAMVSGIWIHRLEGGKLVER